MVFRDDGDIIRALGFVTLQAAYLEEQVDNLLGMLAQIEPFPVEEQRWPVSRKVAKAKRLATNLEFDYRDELCTALDCSRYLFEQRNEVVHGRIYANWDRPDSLRSGRPRIPEREITSAELYDLVNKLSDMQRALYRPLIF